MLKSGLKKDITALKRAMKIWREYAPKYWTFAMLRRILQRISGYFSLAMSALLLDEISGARDEKRLIIFAVLTVLGGFIFSVLSRAAQMKENILDSQNYYQYVRIMFDENCKLQYEHLENPDVKLLNEKVDANTRTVYGGLMNVLYNIPNMAEALTELVLSLSLTAAALFASASGSFHGILGFINSPLSAAAMIIVIFLFSILTAKLSKLRQHGIDSALSGVSLTSRRYAAFGSLWGEDMTVFGLHPIVLGEYRRTTLRPPWLKMLENTQMKSGLLDVPKNTAMQLIIYLYVAAKAYMGAFGIGSFVMYEGAINRFAAAIDDISSTITQMRFNTSYLETTYQFFDLPNNMYKGTLAVEKRDDLDYDIEFKDVSFKYPRTDFWALRHVSMKFKIGDKIAIVGENGSGKSTFIKLLCRLYDPTEGKILLNGIDITRYRYDEYMSLFSVVFQDFKLFAFSLGDNVSAGLGYDESRARDCLKRAGMVNKLNDLDTKETDDGKKALDRCMGKEYELDGIEFSGGEEQKTALARALYKDAPFVILDEPTASLDPIAEAQVYENFNRIAKDRTSVFISHRLSSCRFCERILVFDKGQIAQDGGHEELVREGKYKQLWEAQAGYYVEDRKSEDRR